MERGWNITDFSKADYQYQAPEAGWFKEISGIEVPMGRYTVEIDKEGYSTQYMEILVSENNKPFLIIMDRYTQ